MPSSVLVLSETQRIGGWYQCDAINVPTDATRITMRCPRLSWPDGRGMMQAGMELSQDGGQTWREHGGFGAVGGDQISRKGILALESTGSTWLPGVGNTRRKVRGWIRHKGVFRSRVHFDFNERKQIAITPLHRSVGFLAANSFNGTFTDNVVVPAVSAFTSTDNTLLMVTCGNSANPPDTFSSAVYNDGGAGTDMGSALWDTLAQTYFRNAGVKLIAPSTGTHSITVTIASSSDEMVAGSMFFEGVDQTTPLGTIFEADGNDSSPTVGVTSTVSGNIVMDNLYANFFTATVGSGQTERWAEESVDDVCGVGSTEGGNGGTVTMSHTKDTGSSAWTLAAVEVLAAAAGTTVGHGLLLAGQRNQLVI